MTYNGGMISKTQFEILQGHRTGRRPFVARGFTRPVRVLVGRALMRFVDGGRATVLTPAGEELLAQETKELVACGR